MNLTELLSEMNTLEKRLTELQAEYEQMKEKQAGRREEDFALITDLAKKYPVKGLGVYKASEQLQKEFLTGLSFLFQAGGKQYRDALLYLSRLTAGSKVKFTAEELYKTGLAYDGNELEQLCKDLKEYKDSFLVEAFIVANLFREMKMQVLSIVVTMADFLECEKEEIRVFAEVAKCKLLDSMDPLDQLIIPATVDWRGRLKEYIPCSWLDKKRMNCGEYCIEEIIPERFGSFLSMFGKEAGRSFASSEQKIMPYVITNRLEDGVTVKRGMTILKYAKEAEPHKEEDVDTSFRRSILSICNIDPDTIETTKRDNQVKRKPGSVTAPCGGRVHYSERVEKDEESGRTRTYLSVHIVSYFDE